MFREISLFRYLVFRMRGRVIRLRSTTPARGAVLLSYTTRPYLEIRKTALQVHTNRWECMEIARIFIERGYDVDVIDFENTSFVPSRPYAYVIDLGHNLERLMPYLPKNCVKIFHSTGSDWQFQNKAEMQRIEALKSRRGVSLMPRRIVRPHNPLRYADFVTMLGNEVTKSTYGHISQSVTHIPLSTTHTFPSPEHKDMNGVRKNFIWFAGAGSVHKGLDLVLEAFVAMPEYHLTVCGKIDDDFRTAFLRELTTTPNITVKGFIDPGSAEFQHIADTSLALIYPSCSEGQAGSVVLCMHAGLIPIISRESGVDTQEFGTVLRDSTVASIQDAVRELASLPAKTQSERAYAAWTYAREHHTREKFASTYRSFVDSVLKIQKS